ncbi:MAG TPA: FeoA family protein [Lachnospiraceae bacterium]|nr:FeoA family protein [Lachnospiraceae bacterium]
MPLSLAKMGVPYTIIRIAGREKEKHRLESMGLTPDTIVTIISRFNRYIILDVKGARIGIGAELAKKIILK